MGGYPGEVYVAGRKLDGEQDVQGLQADRLNSEEVASNDAERLGPQELRPARSLPTGAGSSP